MTDMNMPVTLRMGDLMSDDEFCQLNDTLEFERDSHGNIILMSPTGSLSGSLNVRLSGFLFLWNEQKGLGELFDSSAGFTLPNGAQLGWLIDRFDRKAYIYRADGSVETVGIDAVLSGENILPGFSLDLGELIREAATH